MGVGDGPVNPANGSSGGSRRGTTVLAIDTATEAVVTGPAVVGDDGTVEVLAQRVVTDHRRHAELLTTLIAETLAESGVSRSDIDAVVVGTGPGPFTGLRVGMATAAGFADALGVPAYGVCSLDAIAAAADRRGTIVVVTDARRREVYWARYLDGRRVHGPQVAAPSAVQAELNGVAVDLALGSPTHVESVGLSAGEIAVPSVSGLVSSAADAIRAGDEPPALVPLYLRRPDAVERKATGVVRG